MLQAKMTYNPSGLYRVLDCFFRIEFQHRGSPHAHVLLWLENDPHEKISENMPKTIQLLTDLCSVSRNDLPGEFYAAYVVEYVNKSNRGISNLHQELIKIQEQNPEKEYVEIMKQLDVKFLNTEEMSSQEAACYLLRQPMSRSSREVSYIPTVCPQERHTLRKRKAVMDEENLDENITDIWTKSMIQWYEERPSELEDKCLADFVAWYTPVFKKGRPLGTEVNGDASGDDEPAPDNVPDESTSTIGSAYRKRRAPRVIRYRGYELNDVVNYKREMVTLFTI
ncbi:helitron_like_N domain-containing protein [Trichonephila clavipes]|nr:helitron_like_N domain-containing protein [Trichonephila clavipes]